MFDVKTISKAVAGAVAALLVGFLAKKNVVLDEGSLGVVLEGLVAALIGFVTVYFAPKNQPKGGK